MRTAHDIIAMLPDDVHAEVIEGEVIVNAATPAGRHAKIVLAVRRAFARHGIDNLFENTTLLVEHDEAEYVPDLARWPEHLIDGDTWEFPAAECAFALEAGLWRSARKTAAGLSESAGVCAGRSAGLLAHRPP